MSGHQLDQRAEDNKLDIEDKMKIGVGVTYTSKRYKHSKIGPSYE